MKRQSHRASRRSGSSSSSDGVDFMQDNKMCLFLFGMTIPLGDATPAYCANKVGGS